MKQRNNELFSMKEKVPSFEALSGKLVDFFKRRWSLEEEDENAVRQFWNFLAKKLDMKGYKTLLKDYEQFSAWNEGCFRFLLEEMNKGGPRAETSPSHYWEILGGENGIMEGTTGRTDFLNRYEEYKNNQLKEENQGTDEEKGGYNHGG